jgi:hypothetical protein
MRDDGERLYAEYVATAQRIMNAYDRLRGGES